MTAYFIVDGYEILSTERMFSTRDRAEKELLDLDLGEADGYRIVEREIDAQQYFELLAWEAEDDDETDILLSGG